MNANQKCIDCCRKKASGFITDSELPEEIQQKALKELADLLEEGAVLSAPELMSRMLALTDPYTGIQATYEAPKKLFDDLLLSKEEFIMNEIFKDEDPFLAAIQFAVTGNYIDFAGVDDVQESKLQELLDNRTNISLDKEELDSLRRELSQAKRLLYITDNAGEIVLDKMFIRTLKSLYPNLEIAVLARALPVLNDATVEDARIIGMEQHAKVLSNGTSIPGTNIDLLPDESAIWLDDADLCIAKGQGNFESLRGCGRNIYYLFLCKCSLFTEAFQVEQFAPMLSNEKRMEVF